jgi:autotransporter-associated beta strand protein
MEVGSGTTIFSESIDGAGGLAKTGAGTLILSGSNAYTGATAVNAGGLVIDGSITSDTTVAATAKLGGSGVIEGNVVNNGIVAPGNSIGTLWVDGRYTSAINSVLETEIAAGGNTPGTHNDLLVVGDLQPAAVNGGGGTPATTLQGGTVQVISAPGVYTGGTQYTFLETESLTGTFDSITDDLAFFTAQLGYTSTSVYFTLVADSTSFANVALTPINMPSPCTSITTHTGQRAIFRQSLPPCNRSPTVRCARRSTRWAAKSMARLSK